MADTPQDPGPSNMQSGWPAPPGGSAPPPSAQPPAGPPPPGWFQGPDGRWYPAQPIQQKSNTGLILGLALGIPALLALIAVVCILAITFLGTSASVKFQSVGTAINSPDYPTTTRFGRTSTSESSTGESMSAQDFEDELVAQGVDRALASCIVDRLETEGFSFRKYGDLTAAEETMITDATVECASAVVGD